jgi:hypothetical protein
LRSFTGAVFQTILEQYFTKTHNKILAQRKVGYFFENEPRLSQKQRLIRRFLDGKMRLLTAKTRRRRRNGTKPLIGGA